MLKHNMMIFRPHHSRQQQQQQQPLLWLLLNLFLSATTLAFQVDPLDPAILYKTYRLFTSKEIHGTLNDWATLYPSMVQLLTSQQEFGLPTAGTSSDCPHDVDVVGCLNYYAVVQDYVRHPVGSASSDRLPTIMLSGELHGNERVGPTSVMQSVQLLLEAASCESLPGFTTNTTDYDTDMTMATQCRTELLERYNMDDVQRQWLARLLRTRRILLVPTANALGYYRDARNEGDVDPNRDFPFDQIDPSACMQSVAARTMNELYRHYAITNSFTFHGGTELLGYEWGNPSHYGYVSPDDVAQDQLAEGYATYGGSFVGANGRDHPVYPYADMNSIIYYVRGGFEDFAYAGSWDTPLMITCQPTQFGGYDASKTQYDDGMLRSFNMLVEANWVKTPDENDMGTTLNVLYEDSIDPTSVQKKPKRNLRRGRIFFASKTPKQDAATRLPQGHIPRNIRLSIASIDLVQPYLQMTAVNGVALADDTMPLTAHSYSNAASCASPTADGLLQHAMETGAVPVLSASLQNNPTFEWTVGGVISIDETHLWVAALDDTTNVADGTEWLADYICGDPMNATDSLAARLDADTIASTFSLATGGTGQWGTGYFSSGGSSPAGGSQVMGPVFSAWLDVAAMGITNTTTTLVIMASAKVDASWTQLPTDSGVSPANTGPQSHMVQSRTNDTWYYQNPQGYIIEGQSQWFSTPILVQLVNDPAATTLHHNDRFTSPSSRPQLTTTAGATTSEGGAVSTGSVSVTIATPQKNEKGPKDNPDDGGDLRRLHDNNKRQQQRNKRGRAKRIPLKDLPPRP